MAPQRRSAFLHAIRTHTLYFNSVSVVRPSCAPPAEPLSPSRLQHRAKVSPIAGICATPGCGQLTTRGAHCPQHARAAAQRDAARRNTRPIAAIYRDPRWRRCRTRVLKRDHHTCTLCGAPGNTADHHPTPLTTLLQQGHNPYDPATCRTLCTRCSGQADGGRRTNQKGGASQS